MFGKVFFGFVFEVEREKFEEKEEFYIKVEFFIYFCFEIYEN